MAEEVDTAFKQQRLKAWQPILTPRTVLPTFFILGIAFIVLGVVLYIASSNVVQYELDYTDCPTRNTDFWSYDAANKICTIKIELAKDFTGPVFLYYRLTNFYQNHRRYVKSLSADQLKGVAVSADGLKGSCDPLITNPDQGDKIYYPCGLIANSMFNDNIGTAANCPSKSACLIGASNTYEFTSKGIAWSSDQEKYGKTNYKINEIVPPRNWVGIKYGNVTIEDTWEKTGFVFDPSEDEHFQVWMRTAGLPSFRKLYGRLDGDLPKGVYTINIQYNFNVTSFDGTKAFVISTVSWIGGKNPFLGIAYMVVGCISLVLGIVFLLKHCISPRKLGDHTYLSWNQPSAGGGQASSAPQRGTSSN